MTFFLKKDNRKWINYVGLLHAASKLLNLLTCRLFEDDDCLYT